MYELGIFTAGFQLYSPFSLPEEETREQIFRTFLEFHLFKLKLCETTL
jgi:hypothetical protein